jgi:hypothetical protein
MVFSDISFEFPYSPSYVTVSHRSVSQAVIRPEASIVYLPGISSLFFEYLLIRDMVWQYQVQDVMALGSEYKSHLTEHIYKALLSKGSTSIKLFVIM